MKTSARIAVVIVSLNLALSAPAFAMKNQQRHFAEPCELVWKAAVAVAKGQHYRLISMAKDEQIIALDVGGFWGGERIVSLSLAPDPERGCIASVQSKFSGLIHSDAPDLLSRLRLEVIAEDGADRNSKAFQRLSSCFEDHAGYRSEEKCETRYRRDIAKSAVSTNEPPGHSKDWWDTTKK